MLILISGVSGVGKNTVINRLMQKSESFKYFPSGTTREKRPFEKVGEPYIFMDEEEFNKRKANGEFFETQEVHGNFYGVLFKSLDDILKKEEINFIRDIDVFGNVRLRNFMNGKGKYVSIFLDAPDEVIMERLLGRGESEERAKVRISRAKMEREHIGEYDYVISNINLDETVAEISALIEKTKKQ